MFRLHPTGLPADPSFPNDLRELGYFINDEDEIRMIENDRCYFKFFLSRDERVNIVQRETMDTCIRTIIIDRLHKLTLQTTLLPLRSSIEDPHVPILTSLNLLTARRVIVLFYEHNQDLGVLAQRVVGGHGGISAGSCVNFVKAIQLSQSSPSDTAPPGIIIANLGQLRWWRKGKQAVTQASWFALPRKSAVHGPQRFDNLANTVLGNRSTGEHVAYIFEQVVSDRCCKNVVLDIIGVSDGAIECLKYIQQNFSTLEPKLGALALCAPSHDKETITNPEFMAWFENVRARCYVVSSEPANTLLAGPNGARNISALGCNTYSLGEPYYSELLLVKGHQTILDWLEDFHLNDDSDGGVHYSNPKILIMEAEDTEETSFPMVNTMNSAEAPWAVVTDENELSEEEHVDVVGLVSGQDRLVNAAIIDSSAAIVGSAPAVDAKQIINMATKEDNGDLPPAEAESKDGILVEYEAKMMLRHDDTIFNTKDLLDETAKGDVLTEHQNDLCDLVGAGEEHTEEDQPSLNTPEALQEDLIEDIRINHVNNVTGVKQEKTTGLATDVYGSVWAPHRLL